MLCHMIDGLFRKIPKTPFPSSSLTFNHPLSAYRTLAVKLSYNKASLILQEQVGGEFMLSFSFLLKH